MEALQEKAETLKRGQLKLLKYTPPAKRVDERRCFACGCGEYNACRTIDGAGACHWVAWDLCSACLFDFAIQALARRQRILSLLGTMPSFALARYLLREIGHIESSVREEAA